MQSMSYGYIQRRLYTTQNDLLEESETIIVSYFIFPLTIQFRFNESDTDLYSTSHPFKFVKVNRSVSEFGEIGFDVSADLLEEKIVTPEDVGGEVLKYLLKITAKYLGHSQVLSCLAL